MLIFPAIDILDGHAVRLIRGDYAQRTDYGSPLEIAKKFADEGAAWLHIVDLDGAKQGVPVNTNVIAEICSSLPIKVQMGGGIRTVQCARMMTEMGVKRVVIGTRLVQDEGCAAGFFQQMGSKAIAGVDTRGGKVATHGWTEDSTLNGTEFAKHMEQMGCKRVVFTDVATDGTLSGPNFSATREMVQALSIPVIASGGVGSLEDIDALRETGVEGVIVGKAIYENRFTLAEAIALAAGEQS